MAANRRKQKWTVTWVDDDGLVMIYDSYNTEEDAIIAAKECIVENDTDEAFISTMALKVTRDYKVEKL